jgi:hypothetical protein
MVRLVGYFHYLKAAHKFQINWRICTTCIRFFFSLYKMAW